MHVHSHNTCFMYIYIYIYICIHIKLMCIQLNPYRELQHLRQEARGQDAVSEGAPELVQWGKEL